VTDKEAFKKTEIQNKDQQQHKKSQQINSNNKNYNVK